MERARSRGKRPARRSGIVELGRTKRAKEISLCVFCTESWRFLCASMWTDMCMSRTYVYGHICLYVCLCVCEMCFYCQFSAYIFSIFTISRVLDCAPLIE